MHLILVAEFQLTDFTRPNYGPAAGIDSKISARGPTTAVPKIPVPRERRFNSAGFEHLLRPDAMCPGSLRPGWRAPLCGGVFRVP